MRMVMRELSESENELIDRIERLVSELTAMRYWDTDLFHAAYPGFNEILAFKARRERYYEILLQLLTLARQLRDATSISPGIT